MRHIPAGGFDVARAGAHPDPGTASVLYAPRMLEGARRRIDLLLGRRTAFRPPEAPAGAEADTLRADLAHWWAGAPARYARMFLAGKPLFVARGERDLFARLAALGVVERLGPSIYQPCVRLFPLYGRFLATDLLTHDAPDQVFSLMFEQVYVVRNMGVQPGDRVLEPCLGSGVNSLFAADTAAAVTGVDVNPRAIAFARFNAALAPAPVSLEILEGSLLDPLEEGRTFDLILVNPPFELVPAGQTWFVHSDGGEDGLDVVRRILAKVPPHLAPGGRFEIITWSPATVEGPLLVDLLRSALPGMRLTVHVLDVRPLDAHIETFRSSAGFDDFRARLVGRGLRDVQFLFVHAEPAATPGVELVTPDAEIATCHALASAWA